MQRSAPRRALKRRRNPLSHGIVGVSVAALLTGIGIFGVSQAAEASAQPQAQATVAPAEDTISDADAALAADVQSRQAVLDETGREVSAESARLAALGKFYYPTVGDIGSPWGMRMHPILHVLRMHEGVDIGAPCNAPIWAVLDGTVVTIGGGGESGNWVKVDHGTVGGKHLVTAYLHMNTIGVTVGQAVKRGEQLGLSGSTGLSTSCHLHLALWVDGENVDPVPYIKA